jgi:hypothetical protein
MITTLTIGRFLGDQVNSAFTNADFRLRFVQLYLMILITAWSLSLLSRRRYRVSISAQLLGANLFWVIVMLFSTWLRGSYILPIWLLYIPEALLGILISYPLHALMMRYGYERWIPSAELGAKPGKVGWLVMAILIPISCLAVFWSVIFIVQVHSGLPWKEILLILVE